MLNNMNTFKEEVRLTNDEICEAIGGPAYGYYIQFDAVALAQLEKALKILWPIIEAADGLAGAIDKLFQYLDESYKEIGEDYLSFFAEHPCYKALEAYKKART